MISDGLIAPISAEMSRMSDVEVVPKPDDTMLKLEHKTMTAYTYASFKPSSLMIDYGSTPSVYIPLLGRCPICCTQINEKRLVPRFTIKNAQFDEAAKICNCCKTNDLSIETSSIDSLVTPIGVLEFPRTYYLPVGTSYDKQGERASRPSCIARYSLLD